MEYSFKNNLMMSHVPASGMWRRAMAVVIALMATVATWARVGDTFTTGGLTYKVTSETPNREVEVLVYDEDEIPADLTIPSYVFIPDNTEGVAHAYSVKSISDNALNGCSKLTSVIIPYNLTSIGKGAFKDCTGLTEVELTGFLETIGQNAFKGCSGLRKLEFGGSLKKIERDAFKGCENVEEILCFAYNFEWTDYGCDDFKPDGTTLCFVRNDQRQVYEDRWRNGDAADKVNVTFADYYDLMIAGTRVTAKNKNDILGDGAAVYDSETKTLTLNKDITVSQSGVYGIYNSREDLTINVNSSIEIDCAANNPILNYCSNITIKGQGALTLKYGGSAAIFVYGGGSLTIDKAIINTSGTEYGIYVEDGNLTIKGASINISSTEKAILCQKTDAIVLSDCHLINPSGAQLSGSDILDANGNACKALTIIPNNAVGTPIDEAHFPDAIFRNWILAQDYGILGYLPTTVSNVNYIDVKDQGIADLTGIEYFTNLQELYCSNNKLTKLDVSQNTKLEVLHCEGNQISGTNMDALIASLPTLEGTLCAYSTKATEGNEINSLQVAAAKAKNWQVRMVDGTNYTDYAGIPAITIDATNFPDDNFRAWILDQDYGKDGVLTEKETAAIKMINVRAKGITDLKGIEHFTALNSLYCSQNKLTALDVSKNTALRQLSCDGNRQLATLIVSQNTALTDLNCNTNQLTTLDLSKNTELKTLECNNNQLTTLDVSKNTELTTLSCYSNQLTTLDVSKNTKLVNLYCYRNQIRGKGMEALVESLPTVSESPLYILREGLAENNEITTTHVATAKAKGWKVMKYNNETKQWEDYAGIFAVHINATNFPDANFRAFVSDPSIDTDESGYLTEAEIAAVTEMSAAMKDISNLKGIEHFTALTSLDCLGNKLTSLDLSKNTALTKLICAGNQLSELDVTKNTALTYLDCDGNKLTALDLSKNTALEQLYCDENQLTTLDVTQNKKLTLLSCYSNKIYGDGMQTLVGSLHSQGGSPKLQVYTNDAADVNKMTKAQVAAAEAKGWTILMWDGSGWAVYNGITPGDANGDGVVNVADIVAITRSIKGLPVTGFSLPAADMNDDGNADKDDIPLVQKIIMKK